MNEKKSSEEEAQSSADRSNEAPRRADQKARGHRFKASQQENVERAKKEKDPNAEAGQPSAAFNLIWKKAQERKKESAPR